jgi:cell division ATPase FtsA
MAGAMALCLRRDPFQHLARSPAPGSAFKGAETFPGDRIGVGLEFGTSSVLAAVVELRSNGLSKLLVADETPLRGYSNGRIIDFNAAQKCVRRALVNAEVWSGVKIQSAHIAMSEVNFDISLMDKIARCVREIPVEIKGISYQPVPIAAVALTRDQKNRGALVVDVRAGSTDCVIYLDGAIQEMVSVDVGWHHMSDYVPLGRSIAPVPAEDLDVEEASAILSKALPGREVECEMLERRVQMRVREAFQLLKHDTRIPAGGLQRLGTGIFVTDCTGLLRGINDLAEQVFELPAQRARLQGIAGPSQVLDDPKYICAIGLATLPGQ